MRQLKTNDVFSMSRILKKLNINPKEIKIDATENWDEQFGIAIILKIAENAHLAQTEINDFLGSLSGMTGEEFGNLPITKSIEIIKEFKELDGLADFFGRVGQLMK